MARPTRSTSASTAAPRSKKPTPQKSRKSSHNQRSKYFEPATSEESSFSDVPSAANSPTSSSPVESSDDDDDAPPRKKSKVTPKKETPKKVTPKKTSQRKKVKEEEKNEEDEEPWETFVPRDDTPDAGDIPYKNETIHPNTLQFLEGCSDHVYELTVDLAQNNDREWFWSHEVD